MNHVFFSGNLSTEYAAIRSTPTSQEELEWQLVINTSTTIITFLMVFLIQNTQNRDTEAIQIKLDELIRATQGAHNALLDLEDIEESSLDEFRLKYRALAATARMDLVRGNQDTGTPEP